MFQPGQVKYLDEGQNRCFQPSQMISRKKKNKDLKIKEVNKFYRRLFLFVSVCSQRKPQIVCSIPMTVNNIFTVHSQICIKLSNIYTVHSQICIKLSNIYTVHSQICIKLNNIYTVHSQICIKLNNIFTVHSQICIKQHKTHLLKPVYQDIFYITSSDLKRFCFTLCQLVF